MPKIEFMESVLDILSFPEFNKGPSMVGLEEKTLVFANTVNTSDMFFQQFSSHYIVKLFQYYLVLTM